MCPKYIDTEESLGVCLILKKKPDHSNDRQMP